MAGRIAHLLLADLAMLRLVGSDEIIERPQPAIVIRLQPQRSLTHALTLSARPWATAFGFSGRPGSRSSPMPEPWVIRQRLLWAGCG